MKSVHNQRNENSYCNCTLRHFCGKMAMT